MRGDLLSPHCRLQPPLVSHAEWQHRPPRQRFTLVLRLPRFTAPRAQRARHVSGRSAHRRGLIDGQERRSTLSVANNTEMWKRLMVRPPSGASDPYQTDAKYCAFDEPFGAYVYTQARVKRIVKGIGTAEKYRSVFGREPRMKVSHLDTPTGSEVPIKVIDDRSA